MNPADRLTLLRCLLDNTCHSGRALAKQLGVSRTVIWKGIKQLRDCGLNIEARHSKGYRLLDEIDLLDRAEILDEMGAATNGCRLDVLFETASTNQCLTDRFGQPDLHKHIVLAERQHGGKGRRGRVWVSPFARGLYLSLGWHFDMGPASLNALSLASGVAVARVLNGLGLDGLLLKWPNDLMLDGKKTGGILLEARSETAASCDVVIGIGLNVRLPEDMKTALDQPVTDLASHHGALPGRSRLTGAIVAAQLAMLEQVASGRMGEYVAEWRNLDYLFQRQVALHTPGGTLNGRVRGVDDNGLLLLETAAGVAKYSSGELRVRAIK